MEYQIVIARYNEDIRYLLEYSNISIVYNKGNNNIPLKFNYINLPNVGRESHTYLYHIINNYDNLANKTLFIQGNIKDHKLYPIYDYIYNNHEDFIGRKSEHPIYFLKKHIVHEGKYLKELKKGDLKKSKYTPYEWINLIGINICNIDNFEMVWGANFSVSKNLIHKKPKIFYEHLIKYLEYEKNPEEGHYFERAWYLILNHPTYVHKKIILYDFFGIIDIDKYIDILKLDKIAEIHLWNNKLKINNDFTVKYINSINYIQIYPNIINKSFSFQINNNIMLLLDFKGNIYEYLFELDNNKFIIKNNNDNIKIISTNENSFQISWNNDDLVNIYIKSNNNTMINYTGINKLKIYNMISNSSISKDFYRNNYELYYVMDITDFVFSGENLFL